MMTLTQFELVRVKCLLRPPSEYDGWRVNKRTPAVGDVGTLVDILHAEGLPDRFVVECCQGDGETVWLGDFHADELEPYDANRNVAHDTAHLVFLRSGRLLMVKRPNVNWRQLQEDYYDYMASLGPWTADQVASYFKDGYTADDSKWPFSRQEIDAFFVSSNSVETSTG